MSFATLPFERGGSRLTDRMDHVARKARGEAALASLETEVCSTRRDPFQDMRADEAELAVLVDDLDLGARPAGLLVDVLHRVARRDRVVDEDRVDDADACRQPSETGTWVAPRWIERSEITVEVADKSPIIKAPCAMRRP